MAILAIDPDVVELAKSGAIWIGLAYLGIEAIVKLVGTRTERTEEYNLRQLHERLKELMEALRQRKDA